MTESSDPTTYVSDIEHACEILRAGGVILYPTDTVWGIGCDATDSRAVRRVYNIKRRADSKALILLVADGDMMRAHSAPLPAVAEMMIAHPVERPTTIVVDGGKGLAPEVLADDGSVGMRIPNEEFAQTLCRSFGRPIVSTSANISGEKAAACFSDISREIIESVDYVCVSRRDDTSRSIPSKVVKIDRDGHLSILRP
ncbi:L-threonylcarbamoyladenylate synthase [uncultured Muribaculum sp.]|uniref:L-threonylcarbamoyladenylate synthase n=1 Tax=uncultured Muribaculum sp. TaxID=1918613 RepID=UPI0025FE6893|nr:L-threonylcarbamoyladenylate synthase [uncultured Muribaculum sp.]